MVHLKLFNRGWLGLLFCALFGCENRDILPLQAFYPLSSIKSMDITVSDSIFKLYVSRPIEILPKIYDKDGKRIFLPDSLITFMVNGEVQKGRLVAPTDTGSYVITAKLGDIESSTVKVRSLDFIGSIQVAFSRPVFYVKEDTTPVYLSTILRNIEGAEVTLTDLNQLKIFVNDTPVTDNAILPSKVGDYKVQVRLRQHESPAVILPAIDPYDAVKSIRVTAYNIGGTNLGVVRSTRFELRAEVIGKADTPIPFSKDIRFYTNGSALPEASFTGNTAGTYSIQARGYRISSEPVQIILRPDQQYSVVKVPVILHFINKPVPSQSDLDKLLLNINKGFRGTYESTANKDPNVVDNYIEFEWATRSPNGNMLDRPGVHVVTTNQETFLDELVTDATVTNPCWNNFWNPNKYLNVWVLKVNDAPWSGLGSLPNSGDVPISTTPPFLLGTWVNSSGALNPYLMIHEFGHNLGLSHTFNGNPVYGETITPGSSCAQDSDDCDDTPNYHRGAEVTSSSSSRVSCEGVDFQSTNFMDYGPGAGNSFTYDQRKIIRTTTEKGLWLPFPRNRNARISASSRETMIFGPPVIVP